MPIPDKTIPFANLARYQAVRPRLENFVARLKTLGEPDQPAAPVEKALAAELIRETRRTTSRDGFGRALPLLQPGAPHTRAALLEKLAEAETALGAFAALYCRGEGEDAPRWRLDP